ncbi:MAG: hypothetical protein WCO05_04060 [Candidatus Moraniibacteriota bacterium]|jgi:hypothetical protein
MEISGRVSGLSVKRLVLVLAMIFFGWNLFSAIERDACFFPIGKIFSIELFLSKRVDPNAMILSVAGSIARDIKKIWKEEKLEIHFLPVEVRYENSRKYPTGDPTMCVFYRLDDFQGKKLRRYMDFEYNKKFADLILKETILIEEIDPEDDEVVEGKMAPWQRMLQEANQFSEEGYERIREEFPGLVYSFEELRAIRASGIAMSAVHSLAHLTQEGGCRFDNFSKSSRNFKFSKDTLMDQSATMYSSFFYAKFKKLCWLEDAKHKSKMIIPILVLMLLTLHFRMGFWGILSRELSIRRMQFDFRHRAWLCLKFWRQFLFPYSQLKLSGVVADICNHQRGYDDREKKRRILEEVSLVSEELKKEIGDDVFLGDRYLQNLVEIAQGKGDKNLAYRENCLRLLGASLEKLRKKDITSEVIPLRVVPIQNGNSGSYESRSKARARIVRREALLSKVKNLLPKTCSLEFDSWKNSELDDLCLTLSLLRIINNDLVHIFLGRPNFESFIKNKQSLFIVAVKADRREEVASILKEFGASNRFVEEAEVEYRFPDDLEIDVVFGEKPWGKASLIKRALIAFGARTVNCYEASKAGQLLSIAGKTSGNRLVVTTFPPHGHGNIIFDSGLRNFCVQITNVDLFAREVAKRFHKLNCQE